jgi:hypothetical protein
LGEPITAKIFLALVLIVIGIAVVQIKEKDPSAILHPGENV